LYLIVSWCSSVNCPCRWLLCLAAQIRLFLLCIGLQDKSWRVRYNVAAQMVPLCEALGPEMTRAELVPAYIRLLEDSEAEVRIAAAGKVSAFSRMLPPPLIVSQVGAAVAGCSECVGFDSSR
jgi:hypothetical protein